MSAPDIERTPLCDLEYVSTEITERTRYVVSLNGHELGGIEVVAVGDDRFWMMRRAE